MCLLGHFQKGPIVDALDPMKTFATATGLGSVAGLAYLLRSGKPLTRVSVLSAIINSGMTSLVIALMWWKYYSGDGNEYFLVGVSTLAGLGGASVTDFLVQALKRQIKNEK